MSSIEQLLENSRRYAAHFTDGALSAPPSRRVAVVACMDARLMVAEVLGLANGEAHVIRNAGGIVNEETLRSLLISTRLLGTQEVAIINHTKCGLLGVTDEELRQQLSAEVGRPLEPRTFHAFGDLEENVRRQVQAVRGAELLPDDLIVRGFVYDVDSGKLSEVATDAG